MLNRKIAGIAITTLCISLIGCGGGSSDPEPPTDNSDMESNNNNNEPGTVLTGIFVDSAVEGATYTTATQSGTTNSAGEFNYLAGEQVVFSVGDTVFPSVAAAPQVSPVDIASGSSNPEDTTTNIARLLQSLDTDGNPDNGISISGEAAAGAASINFDVPTDQFANDSAVINLVSNSGSVSGVLISAEDANAHLNETLGITNETNNDGLWIRNSTSSSGTGFADYSFLDGLNISRYNSTAEGCYTISTTTATSLGNNRYQVNADDGPVFYTAVRVDDTLEVTFDGESTLIYPRADGVDRNTLPLCDADGNSPDPNEEEIVLDLRNSVWIVNHNPGLCPTAGNQNILRYSESRFSGENIKYNEACEVSSSSWSWDIALDDDDGPGFMFLCGGDGQCTFDEINRTITLTADDPRNGCNDADGEPRPITRQISHEPGSNYFEYTNCPNDDGYRGRYVRQ